MSSCVDQSLFDDDGDTEWIILLFGFKDLIVHQISEEVNDFNVIATKFLAQWFDC